MIKVVDDTISKGVHIKADTYIKGVFYIPVEGIKPSIVHEGFEFPVGFTSWTPMHKE